MKSKHFIIGAIALIIIIIAIAVNSGSCRRSIVDMKSDLGGGLERTINVYTANGDLIATYKGKFDIEENTSEGIVKVKFDMNGERHIIYGSTGTIVIDEIPEE